MPRLPKIPKLELRAEGINESRTKEFSPGFVYSDNRRYLDGYTNHGLLMGSAFGRATRGGQGWITYSVSPRNKLQIGYRLQTVSRDLSGGGRLADYFAHGEFMLGSGFSVSGLVQYEQWAFPAIVPTRQSDATVAVQLTFYPRWHIQ
jgi:hypothetical protein